MRGVVRPFRGVHPSVHPTAFVAETAVVVGEVSLGPESSVWHGCVLRGDVQRIRVGARSNIQDGSILHEESPPDGSDHRVSGGGLPVEVGDGVTVGHGVILHACSVGDGALVGMGSVLLDGSRLEPGAWLAAGSLLTPGKVVPSGMLWGGRPARPMRPLTEAEVAFGPVSAERYVRLAAAHAAEGCCPAPSATGAAAAECCPPAADDGGECCPDGRPQGEGAR